MADIKTVQLIVNSEQAKNCIRTSCISRETGISLYDEIPSGWRIWQSKTTKPCITPFGKILDLCNRAWNHLEKIWMPQSCRAPFWKNMDLCNLAWSHLKKIWMPQPCGAPFGKNLDLCKRAGRQIFQKWHFTSDEGAISLLRGITRTDFYATACNVRRAFPWFPPH